MPALRLMTFNVENLLARFNFREWEKKSFVSLLDVDSDVERANLIRNYWNILDDENRTFTALTMREEDPDVICIQEVENMRALKNFHDKYLKRISGRDYKHMVLIEANDPRGIDVAVLSRFSIVNMLTHQERMEIINYPEGPKEERVFRRDCLEVHVKKSNKVLPIFICHFKSMSGGRDKTLHFREAEATAVKKILEERFGNPSKHDWLVVGDLNDYTETDGVPDSQHGLGPLLDDGFSVDLVKRIKDPKDRWTHFYASEKSYHQLDYMLASPSLAKKTKTAPRIVRKGQPYRAERYTGERWPRVGYDRPKASDHCPVVADIEY